jgi:phage terminase large subunit GpA-like protein
VLVADVVLPPPDITVSQWADENRRLSSESAAEGGEWRTDRAPARSPDGASRCCSFPPVG